MDTISYLRQFRIGGFTVFDTATAFLGILILSPLLTRLFRKLGLEIPLKSWMLLTIPIGIVSHLLIGRTTPLTTEFLDLKSHYILKIIVVGLLVLGIRGIKRVKKQPSAKTATA